MNRARMDLLAAAAVLLAGLLPGGCEESRRSPSTVTTLTPIADLGPTIGSLAQVVFAPESIKVEGYGLVGGLNGTGSEQCPAQVRRYLTQHIASQSPGRTVDVQRILSSMNTAVVRLDAVMPASPSPGETFDLRVTALESTQTTSLEGGWLYSAELYMQGTFGLGTEVLAKAQGPVFIDALGTAQVRKRQGYVLGGGVTLKEYKIGIALPKDDYRLSSAIRNRLNDRYGFDTAKAVSPKLIEVTIPARYKTRKQRFVDMVRATYMTETADLARERVRTFVHELATAQDKAGSEIALEAIGTPVLERLGTLLNSSDEAVRLRAARVLLNVGSQTGLAPLQQIVLNRDSQYRLVALDAVGQAASRTTAAALAARLIGEPDANVRLAAYRLLSRLQDPLITRARVGRSFHLEQIATGPPMVYASRSGAAKIVLFGDSLRCRDNIFVQSPDGNIMIDAPAGQTYVSVIRQIPGGGSAARLRSSFSLADIIRVLCEEPAQDGKGGPGGLGVSYADVIGLLERMCDSGAVAASFVAGPMPKTGE